MSKNPYAPILHTGYANTYSEEMVKQFTKWCAQQGFSGFSMEGKSKQPTDRIDQWIETYLVSTAYGVKHADKNGLDAWLFDEWGYPTGTAAGKVMKDHPEYQSKKLHLSTDLVLKAGQKVCIPVPDNFIAASVWPTGRFGAGSPLAGSAPIALIPIDGKIVYTAKAVERLAIVTWEFDSFRTVGIFIPDLTKPEYATLDLMNWEAVKFFLTQMHERYVKPFEGHWGGAFKGFFYDEPYLSYPFPYTFDILDEFKSVKGYDITPILPLMVAASGYNVRAVLDYRDVCTGRMAKAFLGQMADWCHAHGVEMVGHQDLDHSIRSLNNISGDFFRNSAYSDAPGVDYIWNQINTGNFCDFPRFAGSARRLLGKKHAASESFAAVGRSLFPDQMRFAMEHQAVRGIDRFYLMIVDPDPTSDGFSSPLGQKHLQSINFGKALNHRIALTNRMLNEARPGAQTAILIPMGDVYTQNLLQLGSVNNAPYIWEKLDKIAAALCYSLCDYEYIWDEALLELPIKNGALVTPDGQRIDTIVIASGTTLSEELVARLDEFMGQGGKVMGVGGKVQGMTGRIPLYPDGASAAAAIKHRLTKEGGERISMTHRLTDEGELFFLLNESDEAYSAKIGFPEEGFLSEYDFETESFLAADDRNAAISFSPRQLRIFSLTDTPAKEKKKICGEKIKITGWELSLSDGSTVKAEDVLGDWRRWEDPCFTGFLTYRAEFTLAEDADIELDLGKVCYAAKIRVDGIEKTVAFAPFTANLSILAGKHVLEVSVLNTDANKFIGTPERENETGLGDRHLSMYEHDRFRLESGLFGPVTYRILK